MKKEDFIILILGFLLLAGMLFTLFFGGEKSKHGVGSLSDSLPGKAYLSFHIAFSSPVSG